MATEECDYCWGNSQIERCAACSKIIDECDCLTTDSHETVDCPNVECNQGYVEVEE